MGKKIVNEKTIIDKNTVSDTKKELSKSKRVSKEKSITKKTVNASPKSISKEKSKKDALNQTKKITSNTTSKKTSSKKTEAQLSSSPKHKISEYYDLPYTYNQTIVKILAQTPTTLFVYWDISDKDRNSLITMYGKNFFDETRPVLIVHNTTKNYSFEIEINDFANSWYIRTQEPDCDYVIELGRKFNKSNQEYVYINSSNEIISPNDHILFEKSNLGNVLFRNIKTNAISSKNFGDLRLINNIDKLYGNIYDVYSALYDDETLNEISNPSSGEFYLNRK